MLRKKSNKRPDEERSILDGSDYFTCMKYGTRMRKDDCRRRRRAKVPSGPRRGSSVYVECRICRQGKELT